MRGIPRLSIELKLPLTVTGLVLVVIVVVSTAAYREVRRATLSVASERLQRVTNQLGDLLERSATQLRTRLETQASDSVVSNYLRRPTSQNRVAIRTLLRDSGVQGDQVAATELRAASGSALVSSLTNDSAFADLSPADFNTAHRGIATGPFRSVRDSVVYPTIVPIYTPTDTNYLVQWRFVRSTPESRAGTSELIGSASTLYLGNARGDLWTDLDRRVPAPAWPRGDSSRAYFRDGVGMRLGRAVSIPGTEWQVLLEFDQAEVLSPVALFAKRVLLIVLVVTFAAVVVAWRLSRRISLPLQSLASAAHSISAGSYSHRVPEGGRDEMGVLADAFNQMMEHVQGAHQRLEDHVRERTQELHDTLQRLQEQERHLYESKETAERANYAKSDFLAKMSHELRTPLNSIIGFSEVLQDCVFGELNPKQLQYVGHVLTSGRQLLELINDILDLSKVEVGRMQLHLENVPLATTVSEVMSVVEPLATQKRIEMHFTVDDELPPADADAAKVKQILYNLVGNAIKFTPDGGWVRVEVQHQEPESPDDRNELTITVQDNGIGIPHVHLDRIFHEFEQVDNTYARAQTGTGLGLALTKRLVELHGGRVWVESASGEGSTFGFTLPVSDTVVVESLMDSPRRGSVPDRESPLILIVEDEEVAGDLLAHYLTQAGYRIAHAREGSEALAMASQMKPDAITLDIMLPGLHGHEVLSRLKASDDTRDIPVVVVSVTEDRALGLSLGAADWFVKPARRDDFLEAIQRAVGVAVDPDDATILVVDDELKTVQYLTDVITNEGFRVISTTDGREGIDLALAHQPDAMVLDLLMPDLNGFDVVREIRASPQGHDIPIVVFSTKDLTPEEQNDLKQGVQAIVPKGNGREDLLQELALVCAGTRRPDPLLQEEPTP